jgi:hypothetical protein
LLGLILPNAPLGGRQNWVERISGATGGIAGAMPAVARLGFPQRHQ